MVQKGSYIWPSINLLIPYGNAQNFSSHTKVTGTGASGIFWQLKTYVGLPPPFSLTIFHSLS